MSTKIEWTQTYDDDGNVIQKGETWNPIVGCRRVSSGCQNCYAERMAARLNAMGTAPQYDGIAEHTDTGPRWSGEAKPVPHKLSEPLSWKKPRRVFVNSMSDLFHEDIPFEFIAAVFGVMAACPQHTFQILTKRPDKMLEFFERAEEYGNGYDLVRDSMPSGLLTCAWEGCLSQAGRGRWTMPSRDDFGEEWPLENVWIGASVENQDTADERIPPLLECPAAVRFLSCEPLLGPITLTHLHTHCPEHDSASGFCIGPCPYRIFPDWVIVGGESGPGARPMHPEWATQLRDQCAEADVPFFFKQWGAWKPGYGRTFRREEYAGRVVEIGDSMNSYPFDSDDDPGKFWPMKRVGKAEAGRELEGQTHNEFPEVSP